MDRLPRTGGNRVEAAENPLNYIRWFAARDLVQSALISLSSSLCMCGDSMHFFMSSEGKGGVGKGATLRLWLHAANKFSLAPEKRFNLRF